MFCSNHVGCKKCQANLVAESDEHVRAYFTNNVAPRDLPPSHPKRQQNNITSVTASLLLAYRYIDHVRASPWKKRSLKTQPRCWRRSKRERCIKSKATKVVVTTTTRHVKRKEIHKLSLTKTTDFNEKLKKRGVIYVARVPPRMNPSKIKSLLSDFGVVTRVYLVEEDAARRKRRRKATGNGTKRYMEGWVEFENKGIAKHVALSLNNTPISMHKRNVHYGTCVKVTN